MRLKFFVNNVFTAWLICIGVPLCAQDLVLRYSFDEASDVAVDSGIGEPANGVYGPTTELTTNTPGMISPFALDLRAEGIESFVNGGDAEKLDTLESFTLTTWLLLEGLNADQDGSGNVRLLAKQGPNPFDGFSWNLNAPNFGARDADNFRTGIFIGGERGFGFAFAQEDVFADEWAFLAVTYDGMIDESNVGFYFGDTEREVILLAEEFGSIQVGPVASTAGVADFGVGFTDAAPGVDFAAVGYQDDVRVYDGVLTQEQLDEVRRENLTPRGPVCNPDTGGDIDGDGAVAFADFLILSANFGSEVDSHTLGDIDCNGTVAFADFLILSANFGTSSAGAAVPEPATAGLMLTGCLFVAASSARRRRR